MLYGFIVVAFLIMDLDDRSQMIPFASFEACKIAEEIAERPGWSKYLIYCVATGA